MSNFVFNDYISSHADRVGFPIWRYMIRRTLAIFNIKILICNSTFTFCLSFHALNSTIHNDEMLISPHHTQCERASFNLTLHSVLHFNFHSVIFFSLLFFACIPSVCTTLIICLHCADDNWKLKKLRHVRRNVDWSDEMFISP